MIDSLMREEKGDRHGSRAQIRDQTEVSSPSSTPLRPCPPPFSSPLTPQMSTNIDARHNAKRADPPGAGAGKMSSSGLPVVVGKRMQVHGGRGMETESLSNTACFCFAKAHGWGMQKACKGVTRLVQKAWSRQRAKVRRFRNRRRAMLPHQPSVGEMREMLRRHEGGEMFDVERFLNATAHCLKDV